MVIRTDCMFAIFLCLIWHAASESPTVTNGFNPTTLPSVTPPAAGTDVSRTNAANAAADDDADDNDPYCTNVDIRNNLRWLWLIENCTVINGFLHLVLIESATVEQLANASFPKLR